MAGGIGKKIEGAVKRGVKGKATGGGKATGRKGSAGRKGKGGAGGKVERAAREILK